MKRLTLLTLILFACGAQAQPAKLMQKPVHSPTSVTNTTEQPTTKTKDFFCTKTKPEVESCATTHSLHLYA